MRVTEAACWGPALPLGAACSGEGWTAPGVAFPGIQISVPTLCCSPRRAAGVFCGLVGGFWLLFRFFACVVGFDSGFSVHFNMYP